MDIYEYGHWEGLVFMLDRPLTETVLDADGVGGHTATMIDCTVARGPDGEIPTQEQLDWAVAVMLDDQLASFEVGRHPSRKRRLYSR